MRLRTLGEPRPKRPSPAQRARARAAARAARLARLTGPINTKFGGLTTFRGNASRDYYGEGPVPSDPEVRWRYPSTGALCSKSADAEGTETWCGTGWTGQPNVIQRANGDVEIREGAYDRNYHFLDGHTGQPVRPDLETGDLAKGSASSDSDGYPLYYAGSRDNLLRVVALDRGTPDVLWQFDSHSQPGLVWNDDWDGASAIGEGGAGVAVYFVGCILYAAIRRNAADIMTKRLNKDASQGSFFTSLLDMKQFVVGLPVRLNKIMDAVTGKDLEVKVRAVDAPIIMEGMLKIANRITSGVILAALIVGASLMMRIETSWTLFGYPGLAILCFLGAAAGGVYLLSASSSRTNAASTRRAVPTDCFFFFFFSYVSDERLVGMGQREVEGRVAAHRQANDMRPLDLVVPEDGDNVADCQRLAEPERVHGTSEGG